MTSSGHDYPVPQARRGLKSRLLLFNSNFGYIFTIVSYLIGVFIFATIVGQVGNVITNRNANRLEFERLLDGAKTYMRHHKVPGGMKRRVLRWYDYSWSRGRIQGGGDINTALGLLPDKLKTELALHVNLSVLKKVTIFQECQPEFLHDLVLKMKAYIFTPGDLICRKGEVAREMFIIADGILDVISDTGRVLTTMKAGDFFGEIGILNLDGLNKRTADVRSVGYSELFSLSREDVLTAMKDYPEAQEILQSLGRKRLMEAKNASKMHRAQMNKKEHDSSGDSDTTGKRIVEKLRSDVKGLKNALRRSRKGRRSATDGADGEDGTKRHSMLRRMSHVQSSEECETQDTVQSPIGAGLPLLQRLKLLKEKQDKERDDKEKKPGTAGAAAGSSGQQQSSEVIGAGLPLTQRLKLLRQKEEKEKQQVVMPTAGKHNNISEDMDNAPSTVRTQQTGVRFDTLTPSITISTSPNEICDRKFADKIDEIQEIQTEVPSTVKKKDGKLLIDKLKLLHSSPGKEKLPSKNAQEDTSSKPDTVTSKTVPQEIASETSNPVPILANKTEVPKASEGWSLLKKTSAPPKKEKQAVVKKGVYLTKSDTVLEKETKFKKKRSRSISPEKPRKRSLRGTVEHLIRDRRRTKSWSQSSKKQYDDSVDVNAWEFPEAAIKTPIQSPKSETPEPPIEEPEPSDLSPELPEKQVPRPEGIRQYDSIDDLSPEYSGLPFVKKLKILNERQKLTEVDDEFAVVRSASLDVPDRNPTDDEMVLTRSRSEASAIERKKRRRSRTPLDVSWNVSTSTSSGDSPKNNKNQKHSLERSETVIERALEIPDLLNSPESNETLERRQLKSILKKLSAEEGGSSEEENNGEEEPKEKPAKSGRRMSLRKSGQDIKKLMRAQTVEGYAARHTKLTKSVTFNRDTLQSPPCTELPEETITRGLSPTSPTAILTLQLSNLSMIPIASPSPIKPEKPDPMDKFQLDPSIPEMLIKLQEEAQKLPYLVQEMGDRRNFRLIPYRKSQEEDLGEVIGGIRHVIQGHLEDIQNKFQNQFESLEMEVKKRDEIIAQLQAKIQQMGSPERLSRSEKSEETDSGGTDPDGSDTPFLQRGDSFETVLGSSPPHLGDVASGPTSPINLRSIGCSPIKSFQACDPVRNDTNPFRTLREDSDESENRFEASETDDDVFDIRDKISLLSNTTIRDRPTGRWSRKPWESQSEEEMELLDMNSQYPGECAGMKGYGTGRRMMRNFSVDETGLSRGRHHRVQKGMSLDVDSDESRDQFDEKGNAKFDTSSRGNIFDRVSEFRRSLNKTSDRDSTVVDMNESTDSSDVDLPHNKDWEIEMLVEEMKRKERKATPTRENRNEEDDDWEQLHEMKRLEDEVSDLKKMVCETNLTRLSASELDILETIIEAKDRKISQIAKSNSSEDGTVPSDVSHRKQNTKNESKKKTSFREKLGQALSFDFHDIDNRKRRSLYEQGKRKSFSLRKQKTTSRSFQERQSLDNLLHTSSLLRNRVLEESSGEPLAGSAVLAGSRNSLPGFHKSASLKNLNIRTSLPSLSMRDPYRNSSRISSTSSAELKESLESVFDEDPEKESLLDTRRRRQHPSTSDSSSSSFTSFSFIKAVGSRVKQAVARDQALLRDQAVPTISQLCDDQAETQLRSDLTREGDVSSLESLNGTKSSTRDAPDL